MGCRLRPILKSHVIEFDDVKGKTVVVDGTNYLVRYMTKAIIVDKNYRDEGREPASHLLGIFYLAINLLERKVKPIFVFDGMPMEEKRKIPYFKVTKMVYLWKKYHESTHNNDVDGRNSTLNDYSFAFEKAIVECIEFIRLMGLPVIRAPSEGEAQACKMVREKHAHGIISYDFDALLFGSKAMFKDLNFEENTLVKFDLLENLKEWNITYKQLVDIGLLIGTDLNKGGVKGIGPKKALKLIQEHGNLETINEECIPLEFDFQALRRKFLDPPSVNFVPRFRYPNLPVLKTFLYHKFSKKRVERGVSRLREGFDRFKLRQRNLDRFFGCGELGK